MFRAYWEAWRAQESGRGRGYREIYYAGRDGLLAGVVQNSSIDVVGLDQEITGETDDLMMSLSLHIRTCYVVVKRILSPTSHALL